MDDPRLLPRPVSADRGESGHDPADPHSPPRPPQCSPPRSTALLRRTPNSRPGPAGVLLTSSRAVRGPPLQPRDQGHWGPQGSPGQERREDRRKRQGPPSRPANLPRRPPTPRTPPRPERRPQRNREQGSVGRPTGAAPGKCPRSLRGGHRGTLPAAPAGAERAWTVRALKDRPGPGPPPASAAPRGWPPGDPDDPGPRPLPSRAAPPARPGLRPELGARRWGAVGAAPRWRGSGAAPGRTPGPARHCRPDSPPQPGGASSVPAARAARPRACSPAPAAPQLLPPASRAEWRSSRAPGPAPTRPASGARSTPPP
ncbi:proline-rich protein 2-like [Lontra canadensis]|uniref:proline-rich protein 2-like n=1 Tax=Lontra canadensis TaxID=76717 RepID=UPI0013F35AE8|nr:proline-rich protein 2-like [Lontra canadensis]